MNLPNWISTPHLRRVLQRMQTDYTSIFGGRDRELGTLDAWLADEDRPYALLLAPTGRGKTALVWHWLARQQHEWQVIFVPVSIRYGNSSQADVFAALTHAFAHMHGELAEFNALQHSANELRPKLAAYLRRDLPDNTRVLLAIDGLDEATGWELGADLLPADPPANLKIMLSARDMAQHQRADWYYKLGLHADRTQDFTLGGLDRIALKELLIALGTPLDELAAEFDVLGELLRVSAGDPVIVRLLVQLLREDRIQIGQISQLPADDLNAVFALWLNQLSAQQSQLAQILLLLFANAYGPLSARDLLGLAPDHFATADQITQAIAPLARFVIGDAESGYIFSHQKLRELYRDRLDETTLAEWNARFVNYGKQAHQDPTPYLCRFLVNHLRDAGEWQFIRDLLADFSPQQAWAEARYALEGSYNGYLRDLEVLQTWAVEQQDLALSIHCSLISSSIISMSSNLSEELLVQLVKVGTKQGKWSVEAALAHVEQQIHGGLGKLRALIDAGIAVPWEHALDIVEHHNNIKTEYSYLWYMAIYPICPPAFQDELLHRIYQETTNSPFVSAEKILHFSHQLNAEWQAKFVEYIFTAQNISHANLGVDWSQALEATPKNWQAQMYQFILSQIKPEKPMHFSNLISIIASLPKQQQSMLYWEIPLNVVLVQKASQTLLALLPEQELQQILELFLNTPFTRHHNIQYFHHNLLLLYTHHFPHKTELLDIAIEGLSKDPSNLATEIIQLLPEHTRTQITQILLQQTELKYTWWIYSALVRCLPYVPSLHPQLIKKIHSYKPALEVLPFVSPQQQIQIVTQVFLEAKRLNSKEYVVFQAQLNKFQPIEYIIEHHEKTFPLTIAHTSGTYFRSLVRTKTELSDYVFDYLMSLNSLPTRTYNVINHFDTQQQQQLAQRLLAEIPDKKREIPSKIFPYISAEQQKQLFSQLEQAARPIQLDQYLKSIIDGLLNIPNYPHTQLLKIILYLKSKTMRITYLSKILPQFPTTIQNKLLEQIIPWFQQVNLEQYPIYQQLKHISPQVLVIITNHLLKNIHHNFKILSDLQIMQSQAEQQRVAKHIYDYVKLSPWTLDEIIKNQVVLSAYTSHGSDAEIQELLEYTLSEAAYRQLNTLIPRFTPQQLGAVHKQITLFRLEEHLQFYANAQKHHQLLNQAYYYQTLINTLETELPKHTYVWRNIAALNMIAEHLHDHDISRLYYENFRILTYPLGHPRIQQDIHDIYTHSKKRQILSSASIFQLVRYAAKQHRSISFDFYTMLLIPYLETLALDQAQELASQINHSIDQVVNCWP